MWQLMKSYLRKDVRSIERQIVNHVEYTVAKTRFNFNLFSAYQATAYSVRDRLIELLNDTTEYTEVSQVIPLYNFSMETIKLFIICQANLCKGSSFTAT